MEHEQQIRNLRDFLMVYNRMTEICFQKCSTNFNYRSLTMDEERCADSCAGKLIRTNHRLMGTYVQLMPKMVQRRMEEMESKAAEAAKLSGATEMAEGPDAGAAALPEGSSLAEAPLLPSAPAEAPSMISSDLLQTPFAPGLVDVPLVPSPGPGMADAGAAEVPGGSAFSVDLVPAASVAIAASPVPEGKTAAAKSVTPVTEIVRPSSLTKAVNDAAFITVPPLQSPLLREPEPPTTSVSVAAGAPPISANIVPESPVPVTSVATTFTTTAPVMPVEVTSAASSIASPAVPQAPAASVVPLVSAPIVMPGMGLAEGVRSPVGNLDPSTCSIAPSGSEMSSPSSLASFTVTKPDSQPGPPPE